MDEERWRMLHPDSSSLCTRHFFPHVQQPSSARTCSVDVGWTRDHGKELDDDSDDTSVLARSIFAAAVIVVISPSVGDTEPDEEDDEQIILSCRERGKGHEGSRSVPPSSPCPLLYHFTYTTHVIVPRQRALIHKRHWATLESLSPYIYMN